MKLWLIHHFRVLPTDRRYKELSDEQIEILFSSHCMLPNSEEYRRHYIKNKVKDGEGVPKDKLKEMDYSEKEINDIDSALKSIGMSVKHDQ